MAILHGNWLPAAQQRYDSVAETGSLFLWGETWRRATPSTEPFQVVPHALAMTTVELAEYLAQQSEQWKLPQAVEDAVTSGQRASSGQASSTAIASQKRLRKTQKPGPVSRGNQTVALLA
jgi:hypothetical protein